MIISAAGFAAKCHAGQVRKYHGGPYIMHPMRVAGRMTMRPDATEETVSVAWLHDVVEDCNVSLEVIENFFGSEISWLVGWLTNPSKGSKLPRAERKAIDREHVRNAPDTTKIIKMLDRIDNLTDIDPNDDFCQLYCHESLLLLDAIRDADAELAQELNLIIGKLSAV